ncbi:MAG: hypothetical protein AB7N80_00070 [Bdellovibrionales bacterium]
MTGCVSVSIEGKKSRRSENLSYQTPLEPFQKIAAEQVDVAWKNQKTGAIISVVSDCGSDLDPTLEALRSEILQGISNENITREDRITFLGRAALRSWVSGKVDGVETALDLMIVKKDGCSYVFTLVSTPPQVVADRPFFERFLQGVQTR